MMKLLDLLSEQHMIRFILFLWECDHKESDFLSIVDNHYIVQKKLETLMDEGIVERVIHRERGKWYALTPRGRSIAERLIGLQDDLDPEKMMLF